MRNATQRCQAHPGRKSYDVTDNTYRCWPCYRDWARARDGWRADGGTRRGHNLRGPSKPVIRGEDRTDWKGDAAPATTKRMRAQRMYALGDCERCGKCPATDRHHKDGDTGNNDRSNIDLLCRRCHMVVDGRLERLVANRPAPVRKGLRPCANCSDLTPVLNRGRCRRCASYTWAMGVERPAHLFAKQRTEGAA